MALIKSAEREIYFKIVYYGTGFCGKTTNLVWIHQHAPERARGDLMTLATETERTLFFDFLPLDLGEIEGYRTRFQLYTVPGQPMYERTRVAVLTGVDGVVFVADSAKERFKANVQSLLEMQQILEAQGRKLEDMPLVLQYNKRDLPDPVPVPILNARLNALRVPYFEASAVTGYGVFKTLRAIGKRVLARYQ